MSGAGQSLRNLLHGCAARPFRLVRPGGNWGDHPIGRGAEMLLDGLSIEWSSIDTKDFLQCTPNPDQIVYIHGGGGYNSWSSGRVRQVLSHALKVLPGPGDPGSADRGQRARVPPHRLDAIVGAAVSSGGNVVPIRDALDAFAVCEKFELTNLQYVRPALIQSKGTRVKKLIFRTC